MGAQNDALCGHQGSRIPARDGDLAATNPRPDDLAFLAELRRRLRLNRLFQGLSQEEVGELAGLSRSYVAVLETGKGGVDVVHVRRLAVALDLSLPELVDVRVPEEESR